MIINRLRVLFLGFIVVVMCRSAAEEVELKLCPTVDSGLTNGHENAGIRVLHPYRRGADDVVFHKEYTQYAYDRPVALLRVRNLHDKILEIGDLLGNDWFVELSINSKRSKSGLMLLGSSRARFIRKVQPRDTLCLLIGRLEAASKYDFRVGYVTGKTADCSSHSAGWPFGRGIVYSNWLTVDSSSCRGADMKEEKGVPKISLHQLENNIASTNCSCVLNFGHKGNRQFVDLVVVMENQNEFPMRCPILNSEVLDITLYHSNGMVTYRRHIRRQDIHNDGNTIHLKAGSALAIPLSLDIALDEYRSLGGIKIEYDSGWGHGEAELRFDSQRECRGVESLSVGGAGGDVEI